LILSIIVFYIFKNNEEQSGMRRAQSASIFENTRIDVPRQTSASRTRLTTTTTNATVVHLDPSENWKTASGN
jgi:hypothetical protein